MAAERPAASAQIAWSVKPHVQKPTIIQKASTVLAKCRDMQYLVANTMLS